MQAGRRKEVSALPNAWSKDVGWSSRRKSLQAGSDFRRELHLALACIGFGGGVMAGDAAENVPERYWNFFQTASPDPLWRGPGKHFSGFGAILDALWEPIWVHLDAKRIPESTFKKTSKNVHKDGGAGGRGGGPLS